MADILTPEAKQARNEYAAEWRREHLDAVREYHEKWQREHPEKVKEYHARYWQKKANAKRETTTNDH